jgi:hypothetical protein
MMKKGIILIAVLGLVGAAGALEINLFWSTTGINDPSLVYYTGLTNFQPAFVPPTPIIQEPPGTYDLFLWGQFPPDWAGYQIYGLDLVFQGNATHDVSVAYRQRFGNFRRWDGSVGIPLDGVMATVGAGGIFYDPNIPNLMLPNGQALIGAAHVTGAYSQTITMALGALGIACRDPNGNEVDPIVTPATVTFVPEPATVLFVLAVALIKRH